MMMSPRSLVLCGLTLRTFTCWAAEPVVLATPPPLSPADRQSHSDSPNDWLILAPLPDRTGFAGMFAGVLGGKLVCGGGSQFSDKPVWQAGTKVYSDRIFVLSHLKGVWTTAPQRLPMPLAHFASAVADDAVFLAGGCNQSGVRAEAYVIRASRGTLEIDRLPDLPDRRVYASAAFHGSRLYVAGGQPDFATRRASSAVWSLDPAQPENGWRREADLPKEVFLAAMAASHSGLYHIGGVRFGPDGKSVQLRDVFHLRYGAARWDVVRALPEARAGSAAPLPVLPDGRVLLVGGYVRSFPGEPRDHPGFSPQTLVFDPCADEWSSGPILPSRPPVNRDVTGDEGPAPMVAAPAAIWRDHFVVVSGEVRASVRTPAVIAWPLEKPLAAESRR